MSNAKTMTTGGANSAIGPVQMRKAVPFRESASILAAAGQSPVKDNMFSGARALIDNTTFRLDNTRLHPKLEPRVQTVRRQLAQAVAFRELRTIPPKILRSTVRAFNHK